MFIPPFFISRSLSLFLFNSTLNAEDRHALYLYGRRVSLTDGVTAVAADSQTFIAEREITRLCLHRTFYCGFVFHLELGLVHISI
jgi:hypothetical protein